MQSVINRQPPPIICRSHRNMLLPLFFRPLLPQRCDKRLLWQVLHAPAQDQFVSWLLVSTVSIKASPLCCLCFCFRFPFLYWIAQQASSLCVWLIPLAHTPSPSAAVRWKEEGTAIDHFFPHTCTHTPHLQRHYRSTCLMFLWGIAGISFCVILHLFATIYGHYYKSQSRNGKEVEHNPAGYSNNLRLDSQRMFYKALEVRKSEDIAGEYILPALHI